MSKNSSIKANKFLSGYFILICMTLFCVFIAQIANGLEGNYWFYWFVSEWLINYQGGFVRRGLPGELFYQLFQHTGISPYLLILVVGISCFVGLTIFFVNGFIKKRYSLLILPFVFFLGNGLLNYFWIGKNYFLVLIFIGIVYLIVKRPRLYLLSVNLLFIIGILTHEVMAFMGFPLTILLLSYYSCRNKNKYVTIKSICMSLCVLLPSILCFALISVNRGDYLIADSIWNSWLDIPPFSQHKPYTSGILGNGVVALTWDMEKSIHAVLSQNLTPFFQGVSVALLWGFVFILIYFILTNILRLTDKILNFSPKVKDTGDKSIISKILLFQLIFCVIPLCTFTTDYGRWIFFWVTTSFSVILLVPHDDLRNIFPKYIDKCVNQVNMSLNYALGTSKSTIILLSSVIFFPFYQWTLDTCLEKTGIWIVLSFISTLIFNAFDFFRSLL